MKQLNWYKIFGDNFRADIEATFPYSLGATCSLSAAGQQTLYATSSPYIFNVRKAEDYTLTVSYNGSDYSENISVAESGEYFEYTLPDPGDASTGDISLWLFYAGIDNSGGDYSTLADILADTDALSALMSSDKAVDYLVRNTSWASTICANQNGMTHIGLNNYCADTLLVDNDWCSAILSSSYASRVLNAGVPAMTSDNTPEGEVLGTSTAFGRYRAFDGNADPESYVNMWYTNSGVPVWVGYHFTKPILLKRAQLYTMKDTGGPKTSRMQGSNDGVNWEDIGGFSNCPSFRTWYTTNYAANATKYEYLRLYITASNRAAGGCIFCELKFIGRKDV